MTGGSNRLAVLAAVIAEAHREAVELARDSIKRAMDAGAALVEAKALAGHGGWLPFLERAGIAERTAQRYMRLASSGLEPDTVSDLGGVVGALRFLSVRQQAVDALHKAGAEIEVENFDGAVDHLARGLDFMNACAAMFGKPGALA